MALVELGVLLIFIGMLFVVIGSLLQSSGDTKVAFGGFIGPFPFGFANDKRLLWVVIGVSVVLLALWWLSNAYK